MNSLRSSIGTPAAAIRPANVWRASWTVMRARPSSAPRGVRALVDGGRIERPAGAARDDERGGPRIVDQFEVRGEQCPQRAPERDDADGCGRLGRDGRLGLVAPGRADMELAGVEVDVAPAQRGDLPHEAVAVDQCRASAGQHHDVYARLAPPPHLGGRKRGVGHVAAFDGLDPKRPATRGRREFVGHCPRADGTPTCRAVRGASSGRVRARARRRSR